MKRLFGGETTMSVPEDYKACPMMICGAATVRIPGVSEDDVLRMFGCIKSACAWYDQTAERCAVLSIARNK